MPTLQEVNPAKLKVFLVIVKKIENYYNCK